ncbi:hypothetical protein [Rosistilla carotiformis]|nr:hypothetical protein [Rosistilla carotiformis]
MQSPRRPQAVAFRKLIPCGTLLVAWMLCSPSLAFAWQPSSPQFEQRDPDAIHFRKHLDRIAQAADPADAEAIAGWMLPHRDDQQVVYFLSSEPPAPSSLTTLRQKRAENLLRHAAAAAEADDLQLGYQMFWQAAREDPRNPNVLRALGLPADGEVPITIRPGRNADRQLNWPARSYLQVLTPHFMIDARCDRAQAIELAQRLERVYWIWTQVFYPLWENRGSVQQTLRGQGRFESRINRHRVVLFANRQEYIDTLSKETPGIERSTGFYSNHAKITFLYAGADADLKTQYHELTHQLIGEASRMRVSPDVGLPSDFWVVEGIASYMESLYLHDSYATVGGWESSRLQFARYRVRGLGESMPLQRLVGLGRDAVQQSPDIASWYSYAAAYSHLLMDGSHREEFLEYVRSVYEQPAKSRSLPDVDLADFLNVTSDDVRLLRPGTQLQELCLTNTQVDEAATASLSDQQQLTWLDLSRLPLTDASLAPLIRSNPNLDQLSLERTAASDATLAEIPGLSALEELDLTLAPVTDAHIAALAGLEKLETLWLTATQITDASVDVIARLPSLRQVDMQRTAVTAAAIETLRTARPGLTINPLQIVAAP